VKDDEKDDQVSAAEKSKTQADRLVDDGPAVEVLDSPRAHHRGDGAMLTPPNGEESTP
jgi:hypothetical protein